VTSSAALRYSDFRIYWLAMTFSAAGAWLQIVAVSLLVLQLSNGSAAALGVVALVQAGAFFLFALVGGGFADRIERRRLLLVTQSALLLLALLLGILAATGVVRLWMVVVLAFASSVVLSFDQPARAAFLPSLVPESAMLSAIALQTMVFTGASAVAPALAGILIQRFGIPINFFLNAASYLAVILALVLIKPRLAAGPRRGGPLARSVSEGLRQLRSDRALFWVLSGFAVLLFAAPSMPLFLPVFAEAVLRTGSRSLGFLFSAYGAGAVFATLSIERFGGSVRKGQLYLIAFGLSAGALMWASRSRQMGALAAALFLLGASQNAVAVTTVALLQSRVAAAMRGRMMSVNTLLIMGLRPLGDFPLALLIAGFGAPGTALLSALLIGGYGLWLRMRRTDVWSI